jgi:hypothetical protein
MMLRGRHLPELHNHIDLIGSLLPFQVSGHFSRASKGHAGAQNQGARRQDFPSPHCALASLTFHRSFSLSATSMSLGFLVLALSHNLVFGGIEPCCIQQRWEIGLL